MFDSYASLKNNNNFNYNINAVSGTIRKSHPKSIITKTSLNDQLLDKINPRYTTKEWKEGNIYNRDYSVDVENAVVILQVMLCGNDQCVVEFVLKKDFEVDYIKE
jgi:hypothetical protein